MDKLVGNNISKASKHNQRFYIQIHIHVCIYMYIYMYMYMYTYMYMYICIYIYIYICIYIYISVFVSIFIFILQFILGFYLKLSTERPLLPQRTITKTNAAISISSSCTNQNVTPSCISVRKGELRNLTPNLYTVHIEIVNCDRKLGHFAK